MSTHDVITELFCRVDDRLQGFGQRKHSQARLWPSEVVTLALRFALKGVGERAFYRWQVRDYRVLFPNVPSRTRLFRRFVLHRGWSAAFMADKTLLGVADTYGTERSAARLLHPICEGRSRAQLGAKGVSNHRWIVGVKFGVLLNRLGLVVGWVWAPDNVHDQHFAVLAEVVKKEMLVLADQGFHSAEGDPPNLKICQRSQWNERMLTGRRAVETVLSMLTTISSLKHVIHRVAAYAPARLAYTVALFNLLVQWHGLTPDPDTAFVPLSIAEFSL